MAAGQHGIEDLGADGSGGAGGRSGAGGVFRVWKVPERPSGVVCGNGSRAVWSSWVLEWAMGLVLVEPRGIGLAGDGTGGLGEVWA